MAIKSQKLRRVRAIAMVEQKVLKGATNVEIAKEFGVSVDTVERTLSWAQQADIYAKFEDRILENLVPLAYDAIKAALEDNNAKVALEILKGTRLLRTTERPQTQAQAQHEDDLASYIAQKRDRAQLEQYTIDVTPLEGTIYAGSTGHHELDSGIANDHGPSTGDSPVDAEDSAGAPAPDADPVEITEARARTEGSWPPVEADAQHPNAPAYVEALG